MAQFRQCSLETPTYAAGERVRNEGQRKIYTVLYTDAADPEVIWVSRDWRTGKPVPLSATGLIRI